MKHLISLLLGLSAFAVSIVAFLPLFGWLNYYVVLLSVTGAVFGFLSRHTVGRTLNVSILIVALLRLLLSNGIF